VKMFLEREVWAKHTVICAVASHLPSSNRRVCVALESSYQPPRELGLGWLSTRNATLYEACRVGYECR
jgi:hypothetical protein